MPTWAEVVAITGFDPDAGPPAVGYAPRNENAATQLVPVVPAAGDDA